MIEFHKAVFVHRWCKWHRDHYREGQRGAVSLLDSRIVAIAIEVLSPEFPRRIPIKSQYKRNKTFCFLHVGLVRCTKILQTLLFLAFGRQKQQDACCHYQYCSYP